MRFERFEGCAVPVGLLALVFDRAIPGEAEVLQGAQDIGVAAGFEAGEVQVLHAHQPAAAVMAGIQVAADGSHQGAQMQGAGRRGGEAADVSVLPLWFTPRGQR